MKWTPAPRIEIDDFSVVGMVPVEAEAGAEALPPDLAGIRDWDLAVRYHNFKDGLKSQRIRQRLRAEAVAAIVRRAREALGSLSRNTHPLQAPLTEVLSHEVVDLDLDSTLEESASLRDLEPWMEVRRNVPQPLVICVDTSLSMTGEKLALAAVALGVVALQFPDDPMVLIAFESEPAVLKRFDEVPGLEELLGRFMDVPAQGYTDLEAALKESLSACRQVAAVCGKMPTTILVSDGKYTAGRDPGFLGSAFQHLEVIKMGLDASSDSLCDELARRGRGSVRRVDELSELPRVMYEVIKNLRIPVGR